MHPHVRTAPPAHHDITMGGVWSTYLKLCQQLVQSRVYLEMAAHREDTNSQVVIVVCVYVFVSVGM